VQNIMMKVWNNQSFMKDSLKERTEEVLKKLFF
jgi:hypothetical protein